MRRRGLAFQAGLPVLALLAAGPPSAAGAPNHDPSAALFDSRHVLDVRITIAPADWERLRREYHDLLAALGPSRLDHPEPKPYRTYRADVIIDGTTLPSVGLRKRGFLGSASFQRPSLGVRFNEFDKAGQLAGLTRMSLNNNLQDPSQVHQALAYAVFARAGVPAPRCNFARVTVNGKSLGLYSHVEAVDARFLRRHFGDDSGALYEGQLSDFRPDWVKTFERKNSSEPGDRRDLEAVVRALEAPDNELLARLEPLVDLDAYLTFWAVESLIGHWDSYSNNGNNFFVYRVPATGKFQFIPWGADSTFGDPDPFSPVKGPVSVKATSILPHRLYRLPAMRERYRARLREVLQTAWDESALRTEVDRWEALLQPHVHVPEPNFHDAVNRVRHFIRTRRAVLEKELNGPAPEWNRPLRKSACLEKAGVFEARFDSTWECRSASNGLVNSSVKMNLTRRGTRHRFSATGVWVGPAPGGNLADCPTIAFFGAGAWGMNLFVPVIVIQPEEFRSGAVLQLDGGAAIGAVLQARLLNFNLKAPRVLIGSVELIEAGMSAGDRVRGVVRADVYEMPD